MVSEGTNLKGTSVVESLEMANHRYREKLGKTLLWTEKGKDKYFKQVFRLCSEHIHDAMMVGGCPNP